MSGSAERYLRDTSEVLRDAYGGDCVVHACRVARLLLADGRAPWIGRIRERTLVAGMTYSGPLIPLRYAGKGALAWTTHYVAGCGSDVYDPLVGTPIDAARYAESVFGRALAVEILLDPETTARLIAARELCRRLRQPA